MRKTGASQISEHKSQGDLAYQPRPQGQRRTGPFDESDLCSRCCLLFKFFKMLNRTVLGGPPVPLYWFPDSPAVLAAIGVGAQPDVFFEEAREIERVRVADCGGDVSHLLIGDGQQPACLLQAQVDGITHRGETGVFRKRVKQPRARDVTGVRHIGDR